MRPGVANKAGPLGDYRPPIVLQQDGDSLRDEYRVQRRRADSLTGGLSNGHVMVITGRDVNIATTLKIHQLHYLVPVMGL